MLAAAEMAGKRRRGTWTLCCCGWRGWGQPRCSVGEQMSRAPRPLAAPSRDPGDRTPSGSNQGCTPVAAGVQTHWGTGQELEKRARGAKGAPWPIATFHCLPWAGRGEAQGHGWVPGTHVVRKGFIYLSDLALKMPLNTASARR